MPFQELNIERLAFGGDAIAHLENGKTIFVAGGCPGDKARIRIITEKDTFARGTIDTIIEKSDDRVEPRCPYVNVCGGCPWQHVAYEAQIAAKRAGVVDALVRIGKLDPTFVEERFQAIVPSKEQWNYRNKVEFETNNTNGFSLGLHAQGGDFTKIDRCLMLSKKLETAPKAIGGALRYLQGTDNLEILRVGLRSSTRTKDTEIALWTKTGVFPRSSAARILKDAVKDAGVSRVLLKGSQKERKVTGVEVLSGKGYWTEKLNDNLMALSAPSFFQVNTTGAEKLIEIVLEGLEIDEKSRVFDLYSGAGTFTIPLSLRAGEVVAVESYGSSVRDLRRNLENNDTYAEVIGGDVARELGSLGPCDAAVIDPPRVGLATEVIDSLCEKQISRLAYVSCNPATLARDLALLTRDVYEIRSITCVDLFPQTYHVETVVILGVKGH